MHKSLGIYVLAVFALCTMGFSQDYLKNTEVHNLPDAPTVQSSTRRPSDGFFSFGDTEHALHPNKRSWVVFGAAHAALWGSCIFAVRRQRTSLESPESEYPAVAAITALDFLFFKTLSPALGSAPPVYGVVHYLKAGLR